jgi:enamine deaminase RidA (YjgF/YER057c/UK114 family)
MVLGPGRILFVAGQIGWDKNCKLVSEELVSQFEQALRNILDVVREAGGSPEHIGRFTIYVLDKQAYADAAKAIGAK